MPFNGSGGTSQPVSSIYPAVANTLIESAKFNTSLADVYSMLASCIVKDGQQATTARIPFASGISASSVNEFSADTGVTLDGVLLKDGRIDTAQGADIVCAATINLETATGNIVDVTGSTGPVTAITLSQGHWRMVRFTGTPTLTHGASLVLPNAVNHVCAAGDYVLFMGYAAGVVRAYIFPATSPLPFVDSSPVVIGSADKTKKVRFEADGLTTGTTRALTVQDKDGTIALLATDAFTTGDVKLTIKTVADTGWVLMNDGTIGSAASGGTTRANADTEALFTLLWNNTADADCAVSTGRGASAAADFAANKTIALPKALGRALACYGAGSGLTSRAMAKIVGNETHTLVASETPAHTHTANHTHDINRSAGAGAANAFTQAATPAGADVVAAAAGYIATANVTTSSVGSDGAHNNMQPSVFLNVMIKL